VVDIGCTEAGNTDSQIDWILPVTVEMAIVAAVWRPLITAREEARTVMSDFACADASEAASERTAGERA
jgi:hypothetical protein